MSFEELMLTIDTSKDVDLIITELKDQFPKIDVHKRTEAISILCKNHGQSNKTLEFLDFISLDRDGLLANALSTLACFYSTDPVVLVFVLKHLETNKHKDIIWVYYNMSFNLDMSYVDECIDKYCADKEKIKAWVRRLTAQRKRI